MQTNFEKFNSFGSSATNSFTFENPFLYVNWNLGNQCTYKCSYCAKECHDGSFPWPSIEEAIKTVHHIDKTFRSTHKKKTIFFELLGGEVTLWKDLDPLLQAIYATQNKVMLVTNGVRTIDWWKTNSKYFYHVTLSYHPEFADHQHLTKISNLLTRRGVSVCVLLLMYPQKWKECVSAHNYFKKHSWAKTISLQKLTLLPSSQFAKKTTTSGSQNQDWPYEESQLEWMKKNATFTRWRFPLSLFANKTKDLTNKFFIKKSKTATGIITNSFLTTNNLNSWQGWNCHVGIDTLYLEQNGDIKRSVMCGVSPPLGSWRRIEHLQKVENLDSVKWPIDPVVCPYKKCFCAHDFKARKEKPTTLYQST